MNNNTQMGDFISALRKLKNMTQKQLADKLNVTDKAVSKWERGLSYPDITSLSLLASILGVTTNELLSGKREEGTTPKTDVIVKNTFHYANQVNESERTKISRIAIIVLSILFLLAIFTCGICDYAMNHSFSWSMYPISSIVFAWVILVPFLFFKKYRWVASLLSLSIFIVPFLFIIEKISGETWFLSLAVPCSLISLGYLWILCCLFSVKKLNKFFAGSIAMVLTILLDSGINYIVSRALLEPMFDVWDLLGYFILVVISCILLLVGYIYKKRK